MVGVARARQTNKKRYHVYINKSLYEAVKEKYGNLNNALEALFKLEEENERLREQVSAFSGLVSEIRDNTMRTLGAMNSELGKLKATLAKITALTEQQKRVIEDIELGRLEKVIRDSIEESFSGIQERLRRSSESLEFEKWKYEMALKIILAILEHRGLLNDNASVVLDSIKNVHERNASVINKILLDAFSGGS